MLVVDDRSLLDLLDAEIVVSVDSPPLSAAADEIGLGYRVGWH